jgi:hypothetical protein
MVKRERCETVKKAKNVTAGAARGKEEACSFGLAHPPDGSDG